MEEILVMRDKKIRMMTEIGLAVALSAVFQLITFFRMPQGGSVNLEMLPILIIAFRWGGVPGMITGLIYGFLQLVINPYVIHPVQLIMDYPLPYALLGTAGFLPVNKFKNNNFKLYSSIFAGTLVAVLGRFIIHVLSGVIFFSSYALDKGQNPWIYSLIYNGSYIVPAMLLSLVIIIPLTKVLIKEDNY